MLRLYRRISLLLIIMMVLAASLAWAAPAVSTLQKVRFSQTPEKVRIVFDLDTVPAFNVTLEQEPLRLIVELPAAIDRSILTQTTFNDPFVSNLQLQETEPGRTRVVIDLKQAVTHNVFSLKNPDRLVIDLVKVYDRKSEEEVLPGIKHISWLRSQTFGPVQAHILTIDAQSGATVRPLLSNGMINGVEPVAAMSSRAKAAVAVNGSYFSTSGEIIGLLKIDGDIISTPTIGRTAVGIMPDGKMIIDQVEYQGSVTLMNGKNLPIDGVNRERGPNEVILYNEYYGPTTATNPFGVDYVLRADGTIVAISRGNTVISPGMTVLSAHGEGAKALSGLKVGDFVVVNQSLGPVWDKTLHALGAGPMLVKDGSIFLTTKTEEFGSDVAGGRAPRTALGLTKEGNLLLAVVDGRSANSAGMTLLELALFMQELGAVDAMNLDGGGSSEMVIFDKVINKPSDGRERRVGDALAVFPGKLAN
ncbi:MAG: phosphodiester glycosidase family protein [Negativicutes bacterium]|nr:phosphodiester glycosidase family protein [Negativicutes bacterium]MDR3592637.1 phosphodiester glycosidase family protein [Negativicutes bacterium]